MLLRVLRLRSATSGMSRRMQEWAAVGTLSLSMTGLWGYNIRHVKADAEVAVFKAVVGVLRTSLALSHLQQLVPAGGNAPPVTTRQGPAPNPFTLLQHRPGNYVGEVSARQVNQLPQGSWLFEPDCHCVGYLPISPEWLSSPSGSRIIWLQIIDGQPALLQLRERYLWRDQPLD